MERAGVALRAAPVSTQRERQMEWQMDERTRRLRELNALEIIAAELEQLRNLREHELGVRLEHPPEGDPPLTWSRSRSKRGLGRGYPSGYPDPRL